MLVTKKNYRIGSWSWFKCGRDGRKVNKDLEIIFWIKIKRQIFDPLKLKLQFCLLSLICPSKPVLEEVLSLDEVLKINNAKLILIQYFSTDKLHNYELLTSFTLKMYVLGIRITFYETYLTTMHTTYYNILRNQNSGLIFQAYTMFTSLKHYVRK